jgi:hypothetical protein
MRDGFGTGRPTKENILLLSYEKEAKRLLVLRAVSMA